MSSNTPNKCLQYKEYSNLGEYFLKIICNKYDIEIIIYNIVLLDGLRYKMEINLEEMYSLNKMFKCFSNIKEAFQAIIKLIDTNNFKLSKYEDKIMLSLTIKNIYNESKKIQLLLDKVINDNNNEYNIEYINILSNEIKNIRKKNNDIINELK